MTHKKRWLWSLLFITVLLLIVGLGVWWNWVLVHNYNAMIELAKDRLLQIPHGSKRLPWLSLILGSLGFATLVILFVLFFVKMLREMKLNQMQKDFLANMTHELKTPLASLELSSSLLKKSGSLSPQDRDDLWQAHQSELSRLRDEIERLLTASRWEQFHEAPSLVRFDLETWLQASMVQWRRMLPSNATLKRLGDTFEGQVSLDPNLLKLITSNLIDNARKFCGTNPPHITLRTTQYSRDKSQGWIIVFEDQGLGFTENDTKKIFKRFARLAHANDHSIPGTGLGLHLAMSACEAMHLRLDAASEGHNKGARFFLKGHFVKGGTS